MDMNTLLMMLRGQNRGAWAPFGGQPGRTAPGTAYAGGSPYRETTMPVDFGSTAPATTSMGGMGGSDSTGLGGASAWAPFGGMPTMGSPIQAAGMAAGLGAGSMGGMYGGAGTPTPGMVDPNAPASTLVAQPASSNPFLALMQRLRGMNGGNSQQQMMQTY